MRSVIVVGGGSAGVVLASRLSMDPARSVTLIEAGPAYGSADFPSSVRDATRLGAFTGADWGYLSTKGKFDHEVHLYRGKVLGGSSSVNGSVFIPPTREDIQRWRKAGADAFTVADFEEALSRSKVPVHTLGLDEISDMQRLFLESAAAVGLPKSPGFGTSHPGGYGPYPVNNIGGVRYNVALAYLTDAVWARPNLDIRGDTTVDRILFDSEQPSRAIGVLLANRQRVFGDEVILSAGAYGSPAILLRSGIGPAQDLARLGIGVVRDLPVGRGLQDHPFYYVAFGADPAKIGRQEPVIGGKVWTASSLAEPGELDLHITATHLIDQKASRTGSAFVLAVSVTRPDSRGSVTLASRDPDAAPVIDLNFLGEQRDTVRLIEGIRLAQKIAAAEPLASIITGNISPGSEATDSELIRDALSFLDTYHHPVATASIGPVGSEFGVVDTFGAVHGLEGLRVVDASIIPDAPSPATNPTVIGMAEVIARKVFDA
ncbi:GMC family oxidoreductase [Mycobacteroides chelonae]|uniref:Glucose-methanol-choline oxidoreductase N-terminal domain-containing protein n=1 Tax=Mycobacteroides chelonae TaxID=1774 RepID=A0A1S1M4M4_MYCCH|nr:GMC family oxidoreductase N-terminal domain-containing protein [Mycobacteroides chelonae]OHU77493.1 hypothetical protein BKG84_02870 [Mycobacteroides chelonae]QQG87353.1 dehydrogenase [Mycobacteroides chelonae]QQG92169.1 dehydrogenase [Mycobacteroides chelonae]